jgi:hypothetical protein
MDGIGADMKTQGVARALLRTARRLMARSDHCLTAEPRRPSVYCGALTGTEAPLDRGTDASLR